MLNFAVQKDMDMTNKQMRKYTAQLLVRRQLDMVSLPADTALALGIEFVTLSGKNDIKGINFDEEYVAIPEENIKAACTAVRKELNDIHLDELTEEEVSKLERQIVFGSLYVSDYENTFGVNPNEVCDYADGYLEATDNPEEYGDYESFYWYIQSVERT